jgi:hypothetical protein
MDSGLARRAPRNDGDIYDVAKSKRDKLTRRANHPKPVQPSREKYFAFAVGQISDLNSPVSPDKRGARNRHETRGGMRWTQMRF